MSNKVTVCLAQIEVIPANPRANTDKILDCIEKAKRNRAELVCFSELCVSGYLLGDLWERESFLNECEECGKEIVDASNGIVVVFGNIMLDRSKVNEDGRVRKYNSAIIASDGKIVDIRIKSLQPNYREFDDNRHFYDYRKLILDEAIAHNKAPDLDYNSSIILKDELEISVGLCEDFWCKDYELSPIKYLSKDSDLIINISCSPYTNGKNNKRNRVFGNHAKKFKKPIAYINNVGVQNNGKTIYTFDGNSCIYDKSGNQINPYKSFEEGCETFEIDLDEDFGDKGFSPKDDISVIHDSIVYGTKKFMEQMCINKVVIGASGGIDSSVVAAILSEILPPENILLVNMPSKYNSQTTKDLAKELATNIGCRYIIHSINNSCESTAREIRMLNTIEGYSEETKGLSSLAYENVQARDRSSRILAAWASWFGGCFTCNANKSEISVGYATLWGDNCGFLTLLGDLWKTQVYELARYINSDIKNIIPQGSIDIVPSAELSTGQQDPFIYPYLDRLLASFVERWNRWTPEDVLKSYKNGTLETDIEYNGKIRDIFKTDLDFINDLERCWNLYSGLSIFKRVVAPPMIGISRRSFGYDHRESLTTSSCKYTKKYLALKEELINKIV